MMDKTSACSVQDCENKRYAKGMCSLHYQRVMKHGNPLANPNERREPMERFWEKVDKTGSCWTWKGFATSEGYPRFFPGGDRNKGTVLAHRWLFAQLNGPVPDDMHVDHICRNRACVRPEHLRLLTPAENGLYAQQSCRWVAKSIEDIEKLAAERVKSISLETPFALALIDLARRTQPTESAEHLAMRLGRVAKAAGITTYSHWSHEQMAEGAVTILGDIARVLEKPSAAGRELDDEQAHGMAILEHLGPAALAGGKMSVYEAFGLGFNAGAKHARAAIAQRAASAPIGYISQSSLDEMPLPKGEVHGACPAIMPRESDVAGPAVAVYALTQQAAPEAPAAAQYASDNQRVVGPQWMVGWNECREYMAKSKPEAPASAQVREPYCVMLHSDGTMTDMTDALRLHAASEQPVAEVKEGKFANRLEWVSDEAMASVPVGTKLYTAAPVAAAPADFVLAPRAISEDMHAAAVRVINRATGNADWPPMVWAAMLAAAPAAP